MRCVFGGGSSPSASAGIGGSEPSLTPMRIEMPRSFAAWTTSPHLRRVADVAGVQAQAVDAGLDRREREAVVEVDVGDERHRRRAARCPDSAAAACLSGTAMRTISAPSSARRAICSTVALASAVSVFVIVCTTIGASPPTCTSPTCTGRDLRRGASGNGSSVDYG